MKSIKVRQLMIPPEEFTSISEEASLFEAVMALEMAQKECDDSPGHRHQIVLVVSPEGRFVGRLSQSDVMRALEPKYKVIKELRETSRYALSPDFIKSTLELYGLWQDPLEDICRKAAQTKVRDFMHCPADGDCVQDNISLSEAIHQFVMSHHQTLLVLRGEEIVGVLRLRDIFKEVCHLSKSCLL